MLGTGGDKLPAVRGTVGRPHPIAIVARWSYLTAANRHYPRAEGHSQRLMTG